MEQDATEPDLEVEILDRQRRFAVDGERLRRVARHAFHRAGGRGEVLTILLARDRRLRHLNRDYRGIDRATDVLSFPDGEEVPEGGVCVGDVAVSVDAAERQASAAGCSREQELDRLVAHGVLHLLGYDHETDDGEMMALQARILDELREAAGS